MLVLYTNGCPRCKVLEMKLGNARVEFVKCEDIQELINKGFKTAPMLEVDGQLFDFNAAIDYINSLGGKSDD